MREYGLGRLPSKDERDNNYLIRSAFPLKASTRKYRYYNAGGWFGNQGQMPFCVGYSWVHFLEGAPITHNNIPPPVVDPTYLYNEAQKVDEWEGISYEGTSVRAGAKVLQTLGFISNYNWAFDNETLLYTILEISPVVIGVNWYDSMFDSDSNGVIKVGGSIAGGHAILVDGVNTMTKKYRLKNSWGKSFGRNGFCYISFDDMSRLISEDGEIAIATEIEKA